MVLFGQRYKPRAMGLSRYTAGAGFRVAVLGVALLLLMGCDRTAPRDDASSAVNPEVVARVGETVITRSDFERELLRTAAERTPSEVLDSLHSKIRETPRR
jgi:hypothetical protein